MDQMEIRQLVARQRAYFQSGATLPARARVEALRALRSAVAAREEELNDALRADLGKSAFESYMCEVGMVGDFHFTHVLLRKLYHFPVCQFGCVHRGIA